MKTIEEQAKEFIGGIAAANNVPDCINELLVECYCIAALEVRKRLTSWHDLKKEKPRCGAELLLKIRMPVDEGDIITYAVGEYTKDNEFVMPKTYAGATVLRWREIHE